MPDSARACPAKGRPARLAKNCWRSQGWQPYGGSYRPHQPLSAFIGENAGGVWTLFIRDNVSYDTGSLQAWGLEINGQVVPEPATMVLVGAGLTAVIWLRRRRAA